MILKKSFLEKIFKDLEELALVGISRTVSILTSLDVDSNLACNLLTNIFQKRSITYKVVPVRTYTKVTKELKAYASKESSVGIAVLIGCGSALDWCGILFKDSTQSDFTSINLHKLYIIDKYEQSPSNISKDNKMVICVLLKENNLMYFLYKELEAYINSNENTIDLFSLLQDDKILFTLGVSSFCSYFKSIQIKHPKNVDLMIKMNCKQNERTLILNKIQTEIVNVRDLKFSISEEAPPLFKREMGMYESLKHNEEINALVRIFSSEGERTLKRILVKCGIPLKTARGDFLTIANARSVDDEEKTNSFLSALKEERIPLEKYKTLVLNNGMSMDSFCLVLYYMNGDTIWEVIQLLNLESVEDTIGDMLVKKIFNSRKLLFLRAIDIMGKNSIKNTRLFRYTIVDSIVLDDGFKEANEIGRLISTFKYRKWKKHKKPFIVGVVIDDMCYVKTQIMDEQIATFSYAFDITREKSKLEKDEFSPLEIRFPAEKFPIFIEDLFFIYEETIIE